MQCYLFIMNAWLSRQWLAGQEMEQWWKRTTSLCTHLNTRGEYQCSKFLFANLIGHTRRFRLYLHPGSLAPMWYTLFATLWCTHTLHMLFWCIQYSSVRMYESLHWQLHYLVWNEQHQLVIFLSTTLWMCSVCFTLGFLLESWERNHGNSSTSK